MNRRRFLGTLLGLAAVPVVAARVLATPPKQKYKVYRDRGDKLVGFKGKQFFESGYICAPYLPLYVTSEPIIAKNRKLKDNWKCELSKDIEHYNCAS